jgi:hypothetical protein
MEKQAPPPGFGRICPACKTPAGPGFKFCEVCGTPIPKLSTCSKCGTQFIASLKFCDLCGARVIPDEIPEPEELPQPYPEENSEDNSGDPTAPDDEVPEHYEDENTGPEKDGIPERDEEGIQEPDTAELLEKFGDEFDENETLESFHKPEPSHSVRRERKRPTMDPAFPGPVSSKTVDDVLFLSPDTPEPAQHPVNRLRIIGGGIVLIAILAAVYFFGLPVLSSSGGSGTNISPAAVVTTPLPEPIITGTIPQTPTVTKTPAAGPLVPQPTQIVPTDQKFYFHVQKSPITSRVLVIFTGSAGTNSISSADVTITHPDGSVAAGMILPLKGVTEIILDGSKETDRVEIIARMSSGEKYRVYDELVP